MSGGQKHFIADTYNWLNGDLKASRAGITMSVTKTVLDPADYATSALRIENSTAPSTYDAPYAFQAKDENLDKLR